jgi:hypothetical protein
VYLYYKEFYARTMMAFLRTLPNTLWWITAFLSALAFFTQIGIAVARSGAVSVGRLLTEFVFTVVLLAIPLGIGWYGRQRNSLWHTAGGLLLLLAMARIFFF